MDKFCLLPVNLIASFLFHHLDLPHVCWKPESFNCVQRHFQAFSTFWLVDRFCKGSLHFPFLGDQLLHGGMAGCVSGAGLADRRVDSGGDALEGRLPEGQAADDTAE